MKQSNSSFLNALNKLDAEVRLINSRAAKVRALYGLGDLEGAYKHAMRLEDTMEKAVILSRALPAYTGNPNAREDVENAIRDNIPVCIGYTGEGWFAMHIPMLLPKKMEGSAEYIRSFTYPALRRFFIDREPVRYTDCVMIYRHVYDRQRPERRMRDHDNIEINMLTDAVAMYVLPDDSPAVCSHYYCSAAVACERTEVYVVPKAEFKRWLEAEDSMPEEGILEGESAG